MKQNNIQLARLLVQALKDKFAVTDANFEDFDSTIEQEVIDMFAKLIKEEEQ